ncbi:hypothetical protein CHGG_05503 [Chaetomium globosum CBS 148.51]|uniref:HTH CENPB-type domain-containing protein n=1 Tax=Chaetomium globosum (strain ATCC 6205 / CBS 148.51 / DSM 1962 / NBRC 6347 / NRRL 1970) TaxID=306901 RepID=Q2H762_CHAGB|nr:uncharacterized protein CHGG_05503 [Chaetomium globosum CBS 148.51]EAQ88884.1 hypothetical protein CHGG_05503 [Chaetomium globosum CBS 148.51]
MAPKPRDGDRSDSESDANTPIPPFSNPPANHPLFTTKYDTLDDLMEVLHDHAAKAHFSVVKGRSSNKVEDIGYTRFDILCQKGKIRPSEAHSRPSSTNKRGCKWQAVATALKRNGRKWSCELVDGATEHNDHPTPTESDDFVATRSFEPEHKALIASYLDRPAIKNREIAIELRRQFPGILFTSKQLRNARHRLRKQSRGGHTPFQLMMKLLDEKGIYYQVLWAKDSSNNEGVEMRKPEGLFWTTTWCEQQWVRYPWVQILINNERQEGFDWLMDAVNSPCAMPLLRSPKKWNKAAVAEVAIALAAQEELRIATQAQGQPIATPPSAQRAEEEDPVFEGQKRIANRVNPDPEQQGEPLPPVQGVVEYSMAGLYKLWVHMVYAATVEDFNLAWEKLQAYFPQQTAILKYLEESWLPRTTSPVGSINFYLKSFVVNGNTTVEELGTQSFAMVEAMERRIADATREQKNRILREYLGVPWLGKAPFTVSRKALKLVMKQYRLMLGAVKSNSNPRPSDLPPFPSSQPPDNGQSAASGRGRGRGRGSGSSGAARARGGNLRGSIRRVPSSQWNGWNTVKCARQRSRVKGGIRKRPAARRASRQVTQQVAEQAATQIELEMEELALELLAHALVAPLREWRAGAVWKIQYGETLPTVRRDILFAKHHSFRFIALNTLIRQQARGQRRFYVSKNHRTPLTKEALQEALADPDRPEAQAILNRIFRFAGVIKGTRPFWYRRRRECESFAHCLGVPSTFITLSPADLHWQSLYQHMPEYENWKALDELITGIYNVPETTPRDRMNGITPKADSYHGRSNLTKIEEEVIVQYVLDRDSRGLSPRPADVIDMANLLLQERDARHVGKNWTSRLIARRPELDTRFNHLYDYQRGLCENLAIIEPWFRRVANMRAKYGILDCDFYNFDETGFMMDMIRPGMVVTRSDRVGKLKAIQPGHREWATAICSIAGDGSVFFLAFVVFLKSCSILTSQPSISLSVSKQRIMCILDLGINRIEGINDALIRSRRQLPEFAAELVAAAVACEGGRVACPPMLNGAITAADDAMTASRDLVRVPGSVVVKGAALVLLEQHEALEDALEVNPGCDQPHIHGIFDRFLWMFPGQSESGKRLLVRFGSTGRQQKEVGILLEELQAALGRDGKRGNAILVVPGVDVLVLALSRHKEVLVQGLEWRTAPEFLAAMLLKKVRYVLAHDSNPSSIYRSKDVRRSTASVGHLDDLFLMDSQNSGASWGSNTKEVVELAWQARWEQQRASQQSTTRQRVLNRRIADEDPPALLFTDKALTRHEGLTKAQSSLLSQARIGDIGLRDYLFRVKVPEVRTPYCECGRGRETVEHLVVWCADPPLQRPWDGREIRSHRDLQTVLRGVGARSRRFVRKVLGWLMDSGRLLEYRLARRLELETVDGEG